MTHFKLDEGANQGQSYTLAGGYTLMTENAKK